MLTFDPTPSSARTNKMVKKREGRRSLPMQTPEKREKNHSAGGERTAVKSEGITFFKPKAGSSRLHVIPYEVGKGNPYAEPGNFYYERTYFVHRGIGANQSTYVCPARTAGKPCPICEALQRQTRDPNADQDAIRAMAAKERQLVVVMDEADKWDGKKPKLQVLDISYHLFGRILKEALENAEPEERNFYYPDAGQLLKVLWKDESSGSMKWVAATNIVFKAREPIDISVCEAAPCLDDMLIILPYDKLKAIFLQVTDADLEDEDEDDEPKAKKGKPKSGKKSKPVDDEDEDEDDEDDADDSDEDDTDDEDDNEDGDDSDEDDDADDDDSSSDDDEDDADDEDDDSSDDGDDEDDTDDSDEDEDDEESEDDEDEDEDPPPPKKGKKAPPPKKGKKAPPPFDENDEDDEDDEDDPPPPKKGKAVKVKLHDVVKHAKHGICRVVGVDGKRGSVNLKDAKNALHLKVPMGECTPHKAK